MTGLIIIGVSWKSLLECWKSRLQNTDVEFHVSLNFSDTQVFRFSHAFNDEDINCAISEAEKQILIPSV